MRTASTFAKTYPPFLTADAPQQSTAAAIHIYIRGRCNTFPAAAMLTLYFSSAHTRTPNQAGLSMRLWLARDLQLPRSNARYLLCSLSLFLSRASALDCSLLLFLGYDLRARMEQILIRRKSALKSWGIKRNTRGRGGLISLEQI